MHCQAGHCMWYLKNCIELGKEALKNYTCPAHLNLRIRTLENKDGTLLRKQVIHNATDEMYTSTYRCKDRKEPRENMSIFDHYEKKIHLDATPLNSLLPYFKKLFFHSSNHHRLLQLYRQTLLGTMPLLHLQSSYGTWHPVTMYSKKNTRPFK